MLKGVPTHELIIAAVLGAIMGFISFYIVRAIGPWVERYI